MKIYTKTGDDGTTGLIGGVRVAKDALRVEAYGTVDEANSALGLTRAFLQDDPEIDGVLSAIQEALFTLGADLATPLDGTNKKGVDRVDEAETSRLEGWIDGFEDELEPLKSFILPGGTKASAMMNLARGVCRRAERRTVTLAALEDVGEHVVPYLNRLSDLLFVLGRVVNARAGVQESAWKPPRKDR